MAKKERVCVRSPHTLSIFLKVYIQEVVIDES